MHPLGPPSEESRKDWQAVGAATGLGCSVVVSLLLCIGGGILLDRWLGTTPIFVLIGVAVGLFASGYSLYELTKIGVPKRGQTNLRAKRAGSASGGRDADADG
jgi:ATP synthase protein I